MFLIQSLLSLLILYTLDYILQQVLQCKTIQGHVHFHSVNLIQRPAILTSFVSNVNFCVSFNQSFLQIDKYWAIPVEIHPTPLDNFNLSRWGTLFKCNTQTAGPDIWHSPLRNNRFDSAMKFKLFLHLLHC